MTRTRLLARTFFARFFESDLLPADVPQAPFVIWSLALLAAPGLLLPIKLIGELLHESPTSIHDALLLHRLIFITLSMTIAGVVTLIIWDGVFPDRRDARILTPLPVAGYHVRLHVRELADGYSCTVAWTSEFEASGAPESDAVKLIRGLYEAGFDNLRRLFGG